MTEPQPASPEQRADWAALLERRDALWQRALSLWGTEEHAAACQDWLPVEHEVRAAAPDAMRALLADTERLDWLVYLLNEEVRGLRAEVARLERRPPTQEEWADTVRAARVLGLEVSADGSTLSARKHDD